MATFPSGLEAEQMRQTYGLILQRMFAENLLVAPMFTSQKFHQVILPRGKWYDFYTGGYAGEREIIVVSPGLDKIPSFVKDGGIIPLIPARLHAPKNGELLNLEIRHYGKSNGKLMLYGDDGETYGYENGEYSWTELSAAKKSDGAMQEQIKRLADNIYNYVQECGFL